MDGSHDCREIRVFDHQHLLQHDSNHDEMGRKKRYVVRDPFLDVEKLHNDLKDIKIITQDEFDKLFVNDWKTVWDGDHLRCTANKLAALTSMRCGEVLGLRGEAVFDDHIFNGGSMANTATGKQKPK